MKVNEIGKRAIFGCFAWKFFESCYLLIAMPPKLFFPIFMSFFLFLFLRSFVSHTHNIVPLPMPKKVIHIIILYRLSPFIFFLCYSAFLDFDKCCSIWNEVCLFCSWFARINEYSYVKSLIGVILKRQKLYTCIWITISFSGPSLYLLDRFQFGTSNDFLEGNNMYNNSCEM